MEAMRSPYGLSLIELVVVLAVLGVFLTLGVPHLNPDPQAVNQAAWGLGEQVVQARLEAIRQNSFVGLLLDPGGAGRSEERRVGKECRSRWSPYH